MEILWHQAWRLGLSWKKWARITQCLHSPCSFLPALLGVSHPSQPKVSPASLLLLPLAFFLEQGIPAAWRSSWTSPLLLFSWYCFCYHFWWESKNNSKNNTKTVLVFLFCFFFFQPNHYLKVDVMAPLGWFSMPTTSLETLLQPASTNCMNFPAFPLIRCFCWLCPGWQNPLPSLALQEIPAVTA